MIESSTIVFANNYAFDPSLNYELTQIFSTLQEGSRIISSKPFSSRTRRLSDRQLNGKCTPIVPFSISVKFALLNVLIITIVCL